MSPGMTRHLTALCRHVLVALHWYRLVQPVNHEVHPTLTLCPL